MNKQQMTVFCVGYGYSAQALAGLLSPCGPRIIATARSPEKARELEAMGIEVILPEETAVASRIPEHANWLISAPPDDDGCPAFHRFGPYAHTARWIGYLSTTGVYGDLGGRWAFEWTPVNPQSEQGMRRVLAEVQWQSLSAPLHIFRLPGIYGPGRSAIERVKSGDARRIIKKGQVFSRVHVDDIASCLAASLDRPQPGGIFHPCDDEPAPPQDVIEYAARRLGLPVPPDIPYEEAGLSSMAQRFYSECKRVSNARTKSALGWLPKYSDYRTGLESIVSELSEQ